MDFLLQVTLNGLLLCGVYALMAQGLALIWGVLRVVNLAHGEFIMIGAYLAWHASTRFAVDPYTAAPVILFVGAAAGWVVSRLLIIPLIDRPFLMTLLATFGLAIVLQTGAKLTFGSAARITELPYAASGLEVLGARVSLVHVINALFAFGVLGLLHVFLHYSRSGKAMRAVADDQQTSRLVGIELPKVYGVAVAVAIGLTMVSGGLLSPVQPVSPAMGMALTLKAFAIVALGGLGSMSGIVIAAALLALTESYLGAYVPGIGTGVGSAAAFILLVAVLALRPGGVAGLRAAVSS